MMTDGKSVSVGGQILVLICSLSTLLLQGCGSNQEMVSAIDDMGGGFNVSAEVVTQPRQVRFVGINGLMPFPEVGTLVNMSITRGPSTVIGFSPSDKSMRLVEEYPYSPGDQGERVIEVRDAIDKAHRATIALVQAQLDRARLRAMQLAKLEVHKCGSIEELAIAQAGADRAKQKTEDARRTLEEFASGESAEEQKQAAVAKAKLRETEARQAEKEAKLNKPRSETEAKHSELSKAFEDIKETKQAHKKALEEQKQAVKALKVAEGASEAESKTDGNSKEPAQTQTADAKPSNDDKTKLSAAKMRVAEANKDVEKSDLEVRRAEQRLLSAMKAVQPEDPLVQAHKRYLEAKDRYDEAVEEAHTVIRKPGIVVVRWVAADSVDAKGKGGGLCGGGLSKKRTLGGYVVLGGLRQSTLFVGRDLFEEWPYVERLPGSLLGLNLIRHPTEQFQFTNRHLITHVLQAKHIAYTSELNFESLAGIHGKFSVKHLGDMGKLMTEIDEVEFMFAVAQVQNLSTTGVLSGVNRKYVKHDYKIKFEETGGRGLASDLRDTDGWQTLLAVGSRFGEIGKMMSTQGLKYHNNKQHKQF